MKQHRYALIAKDLAARIRSGKVAVGEALPTEAVLCRRYRVSRYTAREALRQLREAGLISRRPRAGTRVCVTTMHSPLEGAWIRPHTGPNWHRDIQPMRILRRHPPAASEPGHPAE